MSYEIIDHTADVGIQVRAGTLDELFLEAAAAFYDLMVDRNQVIPRERRCVRVETENMDEALVAWLSDLLYLFDTEGFLGREVRVTVRDPGVVDSVVWGEKRDSSRHDLRLVYKAVTYHQVKVERNDGGWVARVVFDV